jgi:transcriptional regulator with XRE-family HTH domain
MYDAMSTPIVTSSLTRPDVRALLPWMGALGQRLRELREARGWQQHEAAARLGLRHASQIAQWETGARQPNPKSLQRLADLYAVSASTLAALGSVYYPSGARPPRRQRGRVTTAPLTGSATDPIVASPTAEPAKAGPHDEGADEMHEHEIRGLFIALTPERRERLRAVARQLIHEQLGAAPATQRVPDGKARARR